MANEINYGPMLNAYPDSIGGRLENAVSLLQNTEVSKAFSSFYILPSLFHTDLDRGFSVIDYGLEDSLATKADLEKLQELGIDLKLDFILNHLSANSPQFQSLVENGEKSPYKDFFIDWNSFWAGCGEVDENGVLQPRKEYIKDMFFRKPGLPVLTVEFNDGSCKPYWNTFYQQIDTDNKGKKHYLGQMDLNIRSPLVWDFYRETLDRLSEYGAKIIRLDAFAYAPKQPGSKNFLNEPGTWQLLDRLTRLAQPHGVTLLPEIHSSYAKGTYRTIAEKGYMVYDFFLPGLILDAFEQKSGEVIAKWATEIIEEKLLTVNMLGCHDGIPVLDLQGLLPETRIKGLIDTLVQRGGFVKDLHGAKNVYYQVNATYYSALEEDDRSMILSRAIQLFMPGKPQIWYLDLFAGKNDYAAVKRAGPGGHKEINRTNLTMEEIEVGLKRHVVLKQLELLNMRAAHPVFSPKSKITVQADEDKLYIVWQGHNQTAKLKANFTDCSFTAEVFDESGQIIASLCQ